MTLTLYKADQEIVAKVWMQLCDLRHAMDIPEERKEAVLRRAVDVIRKLESARYHRERLGKILDSQFAARASERDSPKGPTVEIGGGAEQEFEAFLFQGKSTLDILVKLLGPLLGINLVSFGDGGDRVINALRRNVASNRAARADLLIQLIEDNKPWITPWFVDHRDHVTHHEPVVSSGFISVTLEDGVPRHAPPATADGVPFHEAVNHLYSNLLAFCENFLALAAHITFPPIFTLVELPEENRDQEYKRRFAVCLSGVEDRGAAT